MGRVMLCALPLCLAAAQVIEFESGGLKYRTLTRNGVTVMFARMPSGVRGYAVLQTAVSNGSSRTWKFRPEDFTFRAAGGGELQALPARAVVADFIERGNRDDVVKLVSTYEAGLYGITRPGAVNGYEQRRQAALAEVHSTRLKAAAAASAIAFVETVLRPGESTDGAIFFPAAGKPLGPGHLVVRAAGATFEFPIE